MAPGLYAAHVLGPREFAVLALVQVGYVIALGVFRSLFSSVALVSDFARQPTFRHLGAVDAVAGSSALLCLTSSLLLPLLTSVSPGQLIFAMTGVGVALIQDSVRLTSIATRRARDAALNDLCWLVAVVVALALCQLSAQPSAWTIAGAWAWASLAGLVVGVVTTGWRPDARRGLSFVRYKPRLSAAFLVEWTLNQGSATLATYGIGLFGGALAVAGIRAASLVLGPLNVLFSGMQLALLPLAVAARERNLQSVARMLRWASIVLCSAAIGWAVAILLLPDEFLRFAVGRQVEGVRTYMPPLAAGFAVTGLATGYITGLRVLREGARMVKTRVVATVISLSGAVLGYATVGTVLGGLWGLACGIAVSCGPWAISFRRAYTPALATEAHRGDERDGVIVDNQKAPVKRLGD
jgi:hypothetical protein